MNSFIGLDMAWRIDGNHSGIAVMSGDAGEVRLDALSNDIRSMASALDFIVAHASPDTVVAIDAPLVVKNATGQRDCERQITSRFSRYHAGCHSSNLAHAHTAVGGQVVSELERRGFRHDFDLAGAMGRPGRWVFEVYPHPAMVQLFSLERVIRYKKGRVAEKRTGLRVLRQHLENLADGSQGLIKSPPLTQILERELEILGGQALKHYEDTLDAIFCAYLAWYCWRWGTERNEMFGTMANGYIVVPKALQPLVVEDPVRSDSA